MSVVSFLRGSRRRYDEPRYVLVICLCAALIFVFLAAFSAPMTDAIFLVKLTVQPDDLYTSNVVVLLGILGYCWKRSGVEACSRVSAGYQLGQYKQASHFRMQYLFSNLLPSGSELSAPIPATLPLIPTWSTTVLSLQVATFGVTFIVCAIVVSAHFVHTYLARWALVYCSIAAVLQLACYAFDLALFSVTRSAINQSSTIKLGNGTWLAMVAFILLACAIVGDYVQTRRWTTSRRRAPRDTLTITPYTVSEEELGKQDGPTSRDQDVLSLIPANERRSLDQPTIDIIYHSLFEETAPTTSPATTSELGTAVKASPVSPVIDYKDPYKLHSAESGQLAPKIKPIAGPNPSFPNKATTLPDVVVTRQVPLGPREARKVPGSRTTLQPLAPIRRKVTTTRYAPSSYYTYQSGTTSDSDQTISPTTFFPRSSTHGVFSRPTTMHSGVLPPMSERDVSTPSITTQRE